MSQAIIGNSPHSAVLDEVDVQYQFYDPEPSAIVMHASGSDEMIRIDQEGFYVRGVKVPVDEKEAETVYNAFKQWLAWANLQRR